MEQCDKVILFGYLDGYTYELNGITSYVVALETGERVEIPVGGVMGVDEFVEKDKIKLKDVIARIKKLDLGTQKVWLNEILNELGSDYGTLKYKAGYEQGKLEGEWVGQQLKDADKIRQELNKQMIPQFVADWIEDCKTKGKSLLKSLLYTPGKVNSWVDDPDNQETFALAWINGYEVEQEKRYLVKMNGVKDIMGFLNFGGITKLWFMGDEKNLYGCRTHHTRKELEDAGFGDVFNSPLFEVEEVEE